MGYHLQVNGPDDQWRGHFSQVANPFADDQTRRTAVVYAGSEAELREHPQLEHGWQLDHVEPPSVKWRGRLVADGGGPLQEFEADSEDELFAAMEGHDAAVGSRVADVENAMVLAETAAQHEAATQTEE